MREKPWKLRCASTTRARDAGSAPRPTTLPGPGGRGYAVGVPVAHGGRLRRTRRAAALVLAAVAALTAGATAHAQTERGVPDDWSLKPDAVGTGETFRLMFVSTTTRNGSSTDIADYNAHAQAAAAAGHTDIQPYSADFTAIGTTDAPSRLR